MKDLLWQISVASIKLVPSCVRRNICRLCYAAESSCKQEGLKSLLELETGLLWYIDQAAIESEGGVHPKHRLTKYHDFFTSRLSIGESVLDVGCGNGFLANSLAKAGARVVGVDINKKSIDEAQARYESDSLKFIHADIWDLNIGMTFDSIVLSNVLEHIENRVLLLAKLNEIFSPKRLLVRVPMVNRHWTVPFRRELGLPYYCDPTHFTEYTRTSFVKEVESAGLKVKSLTIKWGEIWSEISEAGDNGFVAGL